MDDRVFSLNIKFNDDSSASYCSESYTAVNDSALCQECRTVDFRSLLSKDCAKIDSNGIFISNLGFRTHEPYRGNCPWCIFLSHHHLAPYAKPLPGEHPPTELRAYSLFKIYGMRYVELPARIQRNDRVCLAITPTNETTTPESIQKKSLILCHVEGQEPELFAGRRLNRYFDPSIAHNFLSYCDLNHDIRCRNGGDDRAGMKLIDCPARTIVAAPASARYVALSYVLGRCKTQPSKQPGVILPQSLPATLEDAISATLLLGIRYLWIDQFCINQHDPIEKRSQIHKMDSIYKDAYVTIVAATGYDASHGLPGASLLFPRSIRPTCKYGKNNFVSTPALPHYRVKNSPWFTRGWTFQEAILSPRRLIFTDEQTFFECNSMWCCESLKSSLDALHEADRSQMSACLPVGVHFGHRYSFTGDRNDFDPAVAQYREYQSDYSARRLTQWSDALNAFTGVMKTFEKARWPVLQISGLPFPDPESAGMAKAKATFSASLLWHHAELSGPGRQSVFPSWTWAGWQGRVHPLCPSIDGWTLLTYDIQVLSEDGLSITLEKLFEDPSYLRDHPKLVAIELDADVLNPNEFELTRKGELFLGGLEMVWNLSTQSVPPGEILEYLMDHKWLCLLIACNYGWHFTLVVQIQGDSAVRIGMGDLCQSSGFKYQQRVSERRKIRLE